MSGDPTIFEEGGCPVCGDDIMSFESDEGGFVDGEPCFCAKDCGWHGHISADEGEAWASPTDEVESLVHIIEEQRLRLAKARELVQWILDSVTPSDSSGPPRLTIRHSIGPIAWIEHVAHRLTRLSDHTNSAASNSCMSRSEMPEQDEGRRQRPITGEPQA